MPKSSPNLACQQILHPPAHSIGSEECMIEFTPKVVCWNVAFSNDGKLLAACYGSPDNCVRIWYLQDDGSFSLVSTLKGLHTRTVRCCSFAPVSKFYTIATASFDGTVGIWEDTSQGGDNVISDDWDCIAQLEGHDSECKCVVWNASSTLLATCGRDKTVWLWDCCLTGNIGSGGDDGEFECLTILNGHEGDVKSVIFAASHGQFGDGDEICISASYDNSIRVWAEDGGEWYCAKVLTDSHTLWNLAVSPGSTRLISGSADGSIGIYKCYTSLEKEELMLDDKELELERSPNQGFWKFVGRLPHAHQSEVMSISYSSARTGHGRFASCGDSLKIYREAAESTSDHPLIGVHTESKQMDLNTVQWHPYNGSILATGGYDGCVRIWKYGSVKEKKNPEIP
mmetsp:Transcript_482/g.717  ORF Transcript_482/g.717 Transcript_482/m.717 type:complete len:398 (+) Transcript_482:86-1279(+)